MAFFRPNSGSREIPVNPAESAILFIDVQNFNCEAGGTYFSHKSQEAEQILKRANDAKPRLAKLQQGCRAAGIEVMYTVIQSLTKDGRDRSLDYRNSGFHVPPGCWDAQGAIWNYPQPEATGINTYLAQVFTSDLNRCSELVRFLSSSYPLLFSLPTFLFAPLLRLLMLQVVDCIAPGEDEIVIPKTSSSVFQSTNIDYVLRSMGKKYLILCGCRTDQCVGHAVRDACDLGYLVTLITDCCITISEERQQQEFQTNKGYCRQLTLEEFLAELKTGTNRGI